METRGHRKRDSHPDNTEIPEETTAELEVDPAIEKHEELLSEAGRHIIAVGEDRSVPVETVRSSLCSLGNGVKLMLAALDEGAGA